MAASARTLTPTQSSPFAVPDPKHPSHTSLHPNSTLTAAAALRAASKSPRQSPQPLSGAAAMAEARTQREQADQKEARGSSPNPAAAALNALINPDSQMSRPQDGPAAGIAQMSEPLQRVAKSIMIPNSITNNNLQTSPTSLSSFGSNESTTAPTATATETAAASPFPPFTGQPMVGEPKSVLDNSNYAPQGSMMSDGNNPENPGNRSFTFPGPLPPDQDPRAPHRGMSLPGSGLKSPSSKRHKCPYCTTEFTRHHNLKSHLLTHSQEKPYECPDCHARFRRLHDLKRHTKLHTGERPHICPKCGRKFARGDALARHNKGQGGCAGRRSSFGVDDDMADARGEDAMDGLEYQNAPDQDDDGNPRRISEPTRRGSNRQNSTASAYQHGSTYPPVLPAAGRPPPNAVRPIYPPNNARDPNMNLSPKTGSSLSSTHFAAGQAAGVYAHGGMTESPKPISPGQPDPQRLGEGTSLSGARSPSMSQHMNPQQFTRGAGRGTSPIGLLPPGSSSVPQLPQLPGLGTTDPRLLGSQPKGALPMPQSNAGSASSHGASSGGSMRELLGGREQDMWAYMRDMEARNAQRQQEYENRIAQLETEVRTLRSQLPPSQQPQAPQIETQAPGH